jgi:hypothetical protein
MKECIEEPAVKHAPLAALAYRAGLGHRTGNRLRFEDFEKLKRFAALVAAAEREACAQVAERWPHEDERMFSIAQAIRTRGEAL